MSDEETVPTAPKRRGRPPKPKTDDASVAQPQAATPSHIDNVCPICFPDGPPQGALSVGCEHSN